MDYDRLTQRFRKRPKKSPAARAVDQVRESARDALAQLRSVGSDFRVPRPDLPELKIPRPRLSRPRPEKPSFDRGTPKKKSPARLVIRVGRGVRVRVVVPESYAEDVSERRG